MSERGMDVIRRAVADVTITEQHIDEYMRILDYADPRDPAARQAARRVLLNRALSRIGA